MPFSQKIFLFLWYYLSPICKKCWIKNPSLCHNTCTYCIEWETLRASRHALNNLIFHIQYCFVFSLIKRCSKKKQTFSLIGVMIYKRHLRQVFRKCTMAHLVLLDPVNRALHRERDFRELFGWQNSVFSSRTRYC